LFPYGILTGLKERFRYILQEALEAEIDEGLGYGKYEYLKKVNENIRNVYP